MPKEPNDIENLSPYKLLRNFLKNRVLPCFLFALIVHVAVIGGLSTDYIIATWINPVTATEPIAQPGQGENAAEAPPEGETPPAETTPGGEIPPEPGGEAPVIERVTEQADPESIPKEPSGLGIPLDELNE